ncbi:hypothetical protein OG900_09785 [Streptomyces sp. NBC_00433]
MEQPISRITRLTLTATAAAFLAITAAACTSTTSNAPAPHRTTRSTTPPPHATAAPAISHQAALATVEHYMQVKNQADAAISPALADTVEDGPLYAMSQGGYKRDSGIPAKDRTPYQPWLYDAAGTHLYIPKFPPGAKRWWAAAVAVTSKDQLLVVFAEQSDQSWQMVLASDLDGAPLPPVELDADGYATAVAADGSQPAVDAGRIRAAVVDNFAAGGVYTGTKYLTPTAASQRQISVHTKDIHHLGAKGTTAFAAADNPWTDAYALKTTGGGALVLFAHAHTQTDTVYRGWQIISGPSTRAWLGTTPRQAITATFTCADAALIPSANAKAQLLSYSCEITAADGPPAGRTTSV